jgi:pimeloyl-ACP methyl ester carboxylesterase
MTRCSIAGGGGVLLHVEETGNPDGRPILFIHGFSHCHLVWRKQMESDLAREFRMVSLDIRGHGLSEKPRGAYHDPTLWAEDIRAVIGALHLAKPVLIGSSYGGVIISDYIRTFGDDAIAGTQWVGAVSRLGDPLMKGGFLGGEIPALVPGLFSDDVSESVASLQRFLRLCVHDEPSMADFYFFLGHCTVVPPHVREGLFMRNVNNDDIVRSTRKPVSIVYGDHDEVVSPRMCAHLQALAPGATVATYPEVGHLPFWEAPERFNRDVRDFCSRV